MKRNWGLLVLLLAAAAFAIQPAAAQDTKHKIYIYLAEIMPMSDGTIDGGTVEAQDEMGYGIGYEFRLNKLMGLDFDYMMATHDVDYQGHKCCEIDFNPLSASFNFHLINTNLIDFYVAPTVSYVMWGDFKIDNGPSFSTGDEFALGASAGIDVGGKKFAFVGGLRYLMLDASPDDVPGDVSIDPLLIRAGFAFKF